MNTYLLMMFEFFKTGLFAIGGGLATLPFLREISAKYGWYTLSELSNMIAIGIVLSVTRHSHGTKMY